MASQRVKVIEGGKLVIPVSFRNALGIATGDTLIMEMDEGELRLRSLPSAIRAVQAEVQALDPSRRLLSEELISERRREAEND
jgi:bifunctional DNA-binding transcriptional regulator/antitoxin component of YhaV-PrlF toxin-antitoxin module